MLRNGLYFIAREAARGASTAWARGYSSALVLGSLREDVIRLPLLGFSEYPSFSHFGGRGLPGGYLPLVWPGPTYRVSRLYRRALAAAERGEAARAFVTLGRAAHVLSDVSIPSHVHRAAHDRDPFEWWVEGNLLALAGAEPPSSVPEVRRPGELVQSLAGLAADFAPDRTNSPLGRLLRRRGQRRPVSAALARSQALRLIPEAVNHVRALLNLACRELGQAGPASSRLVGSAGMREEDEVLEETLGALDLPEHMLKRWFDHNRAFCDDHGGRRTYPGLLELLDRCDQALARREADRRQP